MSVYFFHVTEGEEQFSVPFGIDRVDLAAVEREAIDTASGLIADAVKTGERCYSGRIDVKDDQGKQVLSLTFSCPIEISSPFAAAG